MKRNSVRASIRLALISAGLAASAWGGVASAAAPNPSYSASCALGGMTTATWSHVRRLSRVEFRFGDGTTESHRDTFFIKSGKATLSTPTFPGATQVLVFWWLATDTANPTGQEFPTCQ